MTEIKQNRILLILASLVGGVGLGCLIAFFVYPMNGADTYDSPPQAVQISLPTNYDAQESLAADSGDFEEIISLESASKRRLALYRLMNYKSAEQIHDLLRDTFKLEITKNLYAVQRVLFAELTRIDPKKSLELVWETPRMRQKTLLNIVAAHWSSFAPADALRMFSSLDEPWKKQAIYAVFENQGSLAEGEVSELAESLDIIDEFRAWKHDNQLEEILKEPRKAFNLVLAVDTSEFHRNRMLTRTTRSWIEREGIDNTSAMLSLVYEEFADTRFLWGPVISEIAASDPAFVWEQLSSMPIKVQELFATDVFKEWVDRDPDAAIQAITTQEYLDTMASEMYSLLLPWVRAVSDRFLEHIGLVPEDYKKSAIEIAINHLAKNSPPDEVIDLLAQLRLRGFRTLDVTGSFVRLWSEDDPLAAVEWAKENLEHDSYVAQGAISIALGRLTERNPEKAMEVALSLSEDIKFERSVVIALLRQGEIDQALSLLPRVRDSSVFPIPYSAFYNSFIHAGRVDDAIAFADRLEESERLSYYHNMVRPWLRFECESLLENLPKLPSAEIRMVVAKSVIGEQEGYPYLTEAELEFVRSFIIDETDQTK